MKITHRGHPYNVNTLDDLKRACPGLLHQYRAVLQSEEREHQKEEDTDLLARLFNQGGDSR
jgi:hypothetical protein